jgi:hypothetical protein
MEMNKKLKWNTNIHNIEMKMLLTAILNNFDSFKAEIEKRRNDFDVNFDDAIPMSPTECMNTPMGAAVCALAMPPLPN